MSRRVDHQRRPCGGDETPICCCTTHDRLSRKVENLGMCGNTEGLLRSCWRDAQRHLSTVNPQESDQTRVPLVFQLEICDLHLGSEKERSFPAERLAGSECVSLQGERGVPSLAGRTEAAGLPEPA
jgi:hypothetical protein